MKASTSTELYRPLERELERPRWRFAPLWRAQMRIATKRKLPLVILFAPPAIATIIFSFVVYTRYALEAGTTPEALGGGETGAASALGAAMMASVAQKMIRVREQLVAIHTATAFFSAILMAWYGAGLFAEDRRLGAHLLYFSRPLSKLDYALAKLATVATFGALGSVVPALVVCLVATFASPEWSFLKLEGELLPLGIAFNLLWVAVISSIVLAASALAPRKTFALAGAIGFLMLSSAVAITLAEVLRDRRLGSLSPVGACVRIGAWMFEVRRVDVKWAWISVAVVIVVSWLIIARRAKRLEAVA